MSFEVCSACKHASVCTFPRNGYVAECDEYEAADVTRPEDRDTPSSTELQLAHSGKSE